jgi:hypothetical protein
MRRVILIALLVPAVAFGAPKKKRAKKKKAAPPPVEEKETATEEAAPTPDPAPEPAGTPTIPPGPPKAGTTTPTIPPGGTKPGSAPATPTKPTTPATPTPTTKPGTTAPTTPAPATPPQPTAEPEEPVREGKSVDVDSLRQEYLALRDELFKSRARANAVASQLYSTRMSIKLTWGSARHYGIRRASIRVDGATVFEDTTGAIANDDGVRWSGFVAPGRHLVTFHVEAAGKDDDSFTSSTESQVVVKAVANKDLVIAAKGKDNGDIAYEWKRKEQGNYGLGIDVSVKTVAGEAKK